VLFGIRLRRRGRSMRQRPRFAGAAAGSVQGGAADMTVIYLVQHGEKERLPGDPGLTDAGREQALRTARWMRDLGLNAVYSSPQRRAWETGQIIASASRVGLLRDVRLR
jgi:Histidine phosphatase superfamily (branch 1)